MSTIALSFGRSSWIGLASDISLKGFFLFAAAALITALLRPSSAAARHRIWCFAFCGALLLPLLSAVVPQWNLPILPAAKTHALGAANMATPEPGVVDDTAVSQRPPHGPPDPAAAPRLLQPSRSTAASVAPIGKMREEDTPVTTHEEVSTTTATAGPQALEGLFVVVWIVGLILFSLPLLGGALQKRRLLGKARRTNDPRCQAILQELRATLGLSRSVRLFELDEEIVPMAWGILRPLVMLPASCAGWSEPRRRVVLLHELAHVKRLDLPLQLLARSLCAVYWFNPLLWYGLARLGIERERACDDCVLHAGERPSDYAAELVGIAQTHRAVRVAAAVAMARTSRLEDRIRTMFDRERSHLPLTRSGELGLLAAASVLMLFTAGAHPIQIHAEDGAAAPAIVAATPESAKPAPVEVPQPAPRGPATDTLGDRLPEGARLRMGTARFHPPSSVFEIALSPDEKSVVTIGRELIVWDAATGEERWRVNAAEFGFDPQPAAYGVRGLAFSSDSSRFYTPGRKEVVVWNTLSGQRHDGVPVKSATQPRNGRPSPGRAVDVTPDGQTLAVGSADGVVVCDKDGMVLYEIENHPEVRLKLDSNDRLTFSGDYSFGRFSPNGETLAVVTSDTPDVARVVESKSGRELRRVALRARLVRLAFSPDGKQLAATERDKAVRLYDVESGKEVWSQVIELENPYENYTSAVAFAPDGKTVAAGATDNRIHLFDASTGKPSAQLSGHGWYPWALAFTADSKMLYSSGWDGAVRRWNVAARKQLGPPKGIHATAVVAASPNGRTLAYQDDSATIHLIDARDGTERRTFELPGARHSQLTFSHDGRWLAAGGTSGDHVQVAVWDVPSGRLGHLWAWPKGRDPHSQVESLCFTPDGNRLAAAVFRQSTAYVWDLTTGQRIAQLPHVEIYGLAFSPDAKTLATAGWDSVVRFWETETYTVRSELNLKQNPDRGEDLRMYTVCYAPQGGLIATAHLNGQVRVWQSDRMTLRKTFSLDHGRFVYGAMSFSPDGLWLATGTMGGKIALWDPLTGEKVWDVGRHQGYVYTLGFGRDSRTLVSGGDDGISYLWDLQPSGKLPDKDLAGLWSDLAGDDGPAAYQAMWKLSQTPDRAVPFVAEKLRAVKSVMDVESLAEGISLEEAQRRKRLKQLLVDKKTGVERVLTVRRALSLLAQVRTPAAIQQLKDLASRGSNEDLGRMATDALEQISYLEKYPAAMPDPTGKLRPKPAEDFNTDRQIR